ncbi:MAG TPA: hypothetical protein VNA21_14175 [Steroidobacteraceae bacterium]|nr:hypothetical protein [Steroidobacteraceae bacterium]
MEHSNAPRAKLPARQGDRPPNSIDVRVDETRDYTEDTPSLENEPDSSSAGDIGFDRVVAADEAGLGGGLDQAEEAQLGVTDEELAEMARDRRTPD